MNGLQFLKDEWIQGQGPVYQKIHPFSGAPGWEGHWSSVEQAQQAIEVARSGFSTWSHLSLADRTTIVKRFAELLGTHRKQLNQLISEETGKPLWEADTETSAAISKVQNSLDAIHHRRWTVTESEGDPASTIRYRPLGVMVVLGPFNLPAHLPGAHIVPALLAGNTIVFKPSEQAPAVGEFLVRTWLEAGLPASAIQLVHGGSEVAQALVHSREIDGVLFTGSYRAGCSIHQALAGRPEVMLALEMGGNNALIIDRCRDVESAVYQIILSAYITSGQRCTCARRLIWTEEGNGNQVIDRLTKAIPAISVGDPFSSPQPFMGSLISSHAAQQMLAFQRRLMELGGVPLQTMQALAANPAALRPGLLDMDQTPVPDEEWFGPLLVIQRATNLDDAIRLANESRFGLSAGLLSDDTDAFHHFVHRIRAGIVNWNRQTTGASGKLPFGGIGASGNFRPSGSFAADYCSFPVASLESSHLPLPSQPNPGLEEVLKELQRG